MINLKNGGRVAVIGSVHIFSDEYFEKEENSKIFASFNTKNINLLKNFYFYFRILF